MCVSGWRSVSYGGIGDSAAPRSCWSRSASENLAMRQTSNSSNWSGTNHGRMVGDPPHIGDFSRWKEHDAYAKAIDRLMRDLKKKQTQSCRHVAASSSIQVIERAPSPPNSAGGT